MHSLFQFVAPPSPCGYLPDRVWRLGYEIVRDITPVEYRKRLEEGWRRFGFALFRPRCPDCQACQSLRVPVATFRPNRSQRRAWRDNQDLRVVVGPPSVTDEKLELYDRFHDFQTEQKGWPLHAPKEEDSYAESFVDNPFPTQEWCYYLGDRLVGVGYADCLPGAMSAIYFFYDPAERQRSLGTFNVLRLLTEAVRRGIPHLYLGYFVEGCRSLEYKSNFCPNQVLGAGGRWVDFHS
jgi:arginyl-tRNA--protein-N-Asp/Glu arginylyltransferase